MNMEIKISAGIVTQNEDSAEQQDRNLRVVLLSKQIDTMEEMMRFNERMMTVMEMDIAEKQVIFKENDLMKKTKALTEEMRSVTNAPHKVNPIVE